MGTDKSVAGGETAVPANETCGTENLQWNTHPVCKHCLSLTRLGLQGLKQKVSRHVDQVCNTMDKNKDGFIDLRVYCCCKSSSTRKMKQKLKWYFEQYDVIGNGSVV
ncbi:guanylyl cyclase-activating protein 3 [Bubalus bubalis]|uniref:guanylyl cyclase-activating protein 3 n=1 Tax=Bubalus bubalis TaxID=89462 RepID=UPI001E1B7318|nr:guanylyl cyclase-activating protein 3 [Bubalus bubalis]